LIGNIEDTPYLFESLGSILLDHDFSFQLQLILMTLFDVAMNVQLINILDSLFVHRVNPLLEDVHALVVAFVFVLLLVFVQILDLIDFLVAHVDGHSLFRVLEGISQTEKNGVDNLDCDAILEKFLEDTSIALVDISTLVYLSATSLSNELDHILVTVA